MRQAMMLVMIAFGTTHIVRKGDGMEVENIDTTVAKLDMKVILSGSINSVQKLYRS